MLINYRDYDEEISKEGSLQPVEQISTFSTKTTGTIY